MAGNVLLTVVAPVLGNILGTIMLLSPTSQVLRIRKSQRLEAINPLPFPMTAINCIGWVIYSFSIHDPLIFPANMVGFVFGLVATYTAMSASDRRLHDTLHAMLVAAGAYFSCLGFVGVFMLDDDQQRRMWGLSCVLILMGYYAIPLSSLYTVLKERDATPIYLPLAVAAAANGSLWTCYGFAVGDVNIWLPNLLGVVLGFVQVAVRLAVGTRPGGEAVPTLEAWEPTLGLAAAAKGALGSPGRAGGAPGSPGSHVAPARDDSAISAGRKLGGGDGGDGKGGAPFVRHVYAEAPTSEAGAAQGDGWALLGRQGPTSHLREEDLEAWGGPARAGTAAAAATGNGHAAANGHHGGGAGGSPWGEIAPALGGGRLGR